MALFKKKYIKINTLQKEYKGKDILYVDDKSVITKEDIKKGVLSKKPSVPEGLAVKCNNCGKILYTKQLKEDYMVCSDCGAYFRLSVEERINLIADFGTFVEMFDDIEPRNPIDFPNYEEKIAAQQEKTGYKDAICVGRCAINGMETYLCIMNADFMMASMGTIVGEKLTRIFERATAEKVPVIVYTASGGARMQEGIFSLMQMAKVSAAVARHSAAGQLYVTVLTHPTTGGVTASFAMEGDIILAEPKALIGFAGPRVIEQTIRQKLPEGFQTSEFLLEHGFVDAIAPRENQKQMLTDILRAHQTEKDFKNFYPIKALSHLGYILKNAGKKESDEIKKYRNVSSVWEKVQMARAQERPTGLDYINLIFSNFMEFHGDRYFGDDSAIVGGIAFFGGKPVTVIAEQKGRNTSENVMRNFGMPNPEGYRKALRLMKQAEKFGRPVICFIDTPGAYPGMGAEERGQGEAIAKNLMEMSMLKTPIVSFVIGEGGSGGALALGVADKVYMMENSIYSILSPEGFASILWKDGSRAKEAAPIMRITAEDLLDFGIIDDIVPETKLGAAENVEECAAYMAGLIEKAIEELAFEDKNGLINKRYEKFRRF
ncbi:MAG: acetyl-CoA carboxylase carboxyltransferase subunit alpha [Lachnospiraceae bacterium]|nr:acetyl-CoA carboxylase carboxyltransferase subunit alpha [Lachnospiraceae bacterium]